MSEPQAPKYQINIETAQGIAIGDNATVTNIFQQYPELEDYVKDFREALDSTQPFVGRDFIFTAIAQFQSQYDRGYFRIVADAGLGKTALAAAITHRFSATPFFTSASRGITRASQCLNHLCASLIAQFHLEHSHLPARAGEDSAFFSTVLVEAARKAAQPIWIVIDALDEADAQVAGRNVLLLPEHLPKGVYVVLTNRPGIYHLRTTAATPIQEYHLQANDQNQQANIVAYLHHQASDNARISKQLRTATPPVAVDKFVARLKIASEGNFQYLSYVLADIADRPAHSDPLNLDQLPVGLIGYYEQFWQHLEQVKADEGRVEWKTFYKPLIGLLATAGEPVTVEWLVDHSGRDEDDVEDALQRWQRFLSRERRDGGEMWRIVHQSFADFLSVKVDLPAMHRRIATYYWNNPHRWQMHNGYPHRYLTAHLRRSAQGSLLFTLMDDWAWYKAQIAFNPGGAAYLNDLQEAWAVAEGMNTEAVMHDQVVPFCGFEVRCALAIASLHSLSNNIPPMLLTALVTNGLWELSEALSIVRQSPDARTKMEALSALAPHLPQTLVREALTVARDLRDEYDRAQAMIALVPHLPAGERVSLVREALENARAYVDRHEMRQQALVQVIAQVANVGYPGEAFAAARAIKIPHWQAGALSMLAASLPEPLLREVLQLVRAIGDRDDEAKVLVALLPRLPEAERRPVLAEALNLARAISYGWTRAVVLAELAIYLPEVERHSVLQEALEAARATSDPYGCARALTVLALHFPETERASVVSEAFNAACMIGTDYPLIFDGARQLREGDALARVLAELGPHLSKSQLHTALVSIRTGRDGRNQSETLAELVPHLTRISYIEEALAVAREIRDRQCRAEALTKLASYLQKAEQRAVLYEALDTVRTVGDDFYRTEALVVLIPHLPEDDRDAILREGFEGVRGIADEHYRAEALTVLAPHLPPSLIAQGLDIARTIGDEYHRANALIVLIPLLPEDERGAVFDEALNLAVTIPANEAGASFRSIYHIALHLAKEGCPREALVAAQATENEDYRAEVLSALAPHLPPSLIAQGLDIARTIGDEYHRAKALAKLCPQLPDAERAAVLHEALDAAGTVWNAHQRVQVLTMLVPHLAKRERWQVLYEALMTSCVLDDELEQLQALVALIPHLPESWLRWSLEVGWTIGSKFAWAQVLRSLPPHLPEPWFHWALENTTTIVDESDRAKVLAALAPHLPPSLIGKALDTIRTVGNDFYRTEALVVLIPHLPEDDRDAILREGFEGVRGIADEHYRAEALTVLAPHLPPSLIGDVLDIIRTIMDEDRRIRVSQSLASTLVQIPGPKLYPFWHELLSLLAARTRRHLLEHISAFSPAPVQLSGSRAIVEIARAISHVGQWWP